MMRGNLFNLDTLILLFLLYFTITSVQNKRNSISLGGTTGKDKT